MKANYQENPQQKAQTDWGNESEARILGNPKIKFFVIHPSARKQINAFKKLKWNY